MHSRFQIAGLTFIALAASNTSSLAQDLYAMTATHRLLGIRSASPGRIATNIAVIGLAPQEALLGIDFRPLTGELYALGNTSQLYKINVMSGVATPVGAPFVPALNGTQFGFDFNPTVDRIRIISDADQNLRAHPDTGAVVATDGTLAFASGDRFRNVNPNVVACGYTNSAPGATTTQLYGIDSNLDALLLQDPPNAGVLNTVGALGLNTSSIAAMDIDGATGMVWAALTSPGVGVNSSSLVRVNRTTGAAQFVTTFAVAETVIGISVVPPKVTPYFGGQELYLATETGRLLAFDSAAPGVLRSDVPITGLGVGEVVRGIDFRPATGELYALGSLSQLYVLDRMTGQATAIGTPFTPLLLGDEFGFDFNPTVDRIRITSNLGQNLRAHPTTGAVVAIDGNLAYDSADVAAGQTPDLVASGYTNSIAQAASTVLYGIDRTRGTLVVQNPPNAGVLSTVGSLGFGVAGRGHLDVLATTSTAYAVLSSIGSTSASLFAVNLTLGSTTFVATLPVSDAIAGMSVRPIFGTTQYGLASNGCAGLPGIGANSTATVGNAGFAITGSNAPALVEGRLCIGLERSFPPLNLIDVLFHVNPLSSSTFWVPAMSDMDGFTAVSVAIPADPQFQGLVFYAQYFWLDRCGASGLSASHGLAVEIR